MLKREKVVVKLKDVVDAPSDEENMGREAEMEVVIIQWTRIKRERGRQENRNSQLCGVQYTEQAKLF